MVLSGRRKVNKMIDEKEVGLLSPGLLAYIGDSIYELQARSYLLDQGYRSLNKIHQGVITLVQASAQARALRSLEGDLSQREKEIVRRGRNTRTGSIPNNAEIMDYRLSTGLEALFGYHYLCGNLKRLEELWNKVVKELEE